MVTLLAAILSLGHHFGFPLFEFPQVVFVMDRLQFLQRKWSQLLSVSFEVLTSKAWVNESHHYFIAFFCKGSSLFSAAFSWPTRSSWAWPLIHYFCHLCWKPSKVDMKSTLLTIINLSLLCNDTDLFVVMVCFLERWCSGAGSKAFGWNIAQILKADVI